LRREEPAGTDDAVLLGCDPDALVLRVRRSRFLGGKAIGLNQVIVAPAFTSALADADFAGSFYQEVERILGVEIRDAEATVEAVATDAESAALLDVPAGAPLLRTTRVTYLTDGRLLGLTRTLYRGDRYYLSLTIRKDSPG
jgi:GntR family transcriptional regulator